MPATQIQPVLAPRGGLRYDLPANLISEMDMSDCRNVSLIRGLIIKRYGYSLFGDNLPLDSAVIGNDQFYLFGGTDFLLSLTTRLAYKYLPTVNLWDTISESSTEDDCETNWTAKTNVTCALDSDEKKEGTYSVKISPSADFTTGLLAYHDSAFGDLTDYGYVRLWIKSSIALSAGDLQFCIDDTNGCGSPLEEIDIPALSADTWKIVVLQITTPAALSAVASLGLSATTDFGACDINIDEIKFVKSFDTDIADSDLASFDSIRKLTESEPWLVFTNRTDEIKKWTGTGDIADLISSYPSGLTSLVCKSLCEFKDHLLLFYTTEEGTPCPQRIRWSDTGKPDDFLNGNASYVDLSGADWIKRAIKFKGDYIVVFKERSIWVGYATGDSDIFQFDQKVTGAGCAAAKTVETLGDEIIFLGWDDVYVFNGIDYESVGEQIRDELFDILNPEQIDRCFGVVLEDQKEYWLFVPSVGSTYCDTVWIFNYELNKWTRGNAADYMTIFGYYEKQASMTFDNSVGVSFDEDTGRFDDRTILASTPITLLCDKDGNIYSYDRLSNNDNDTAVDSWFSSKDFMLTSLMQRQRILRLDTYYKGKSLKIYYSIDRGVSWNLWATLTEALDFEIKRSYLRLDCDLVRVKWGNNNSGEHYEFREARLYWQPAGMRL